MADIRGKGSNVTSRSWTTSNVKLDNLFLNEFEKLRSIAFQFGIVIGIQQGGSGVGNVVVYGGHIFLINEASEAICKTIHEYQLCTLKLEDEPEKLQYKISNFDSFECLPTKLRIISQRTETEIVLQGKEIVVSGKEENISDALNYLKKLKIIQNHLISYEYSVEKSHEIKEFICGKKDGKINKI